MAGPDLQIREGPGHPDPEIRGAGGGGSKRQFFPPFGSQFGLTMGGPPLDPPLGEVGSPRVARVGD